MGLLLLAVAMTGAIALISDFIFGSTTAVISTVVMAARVLGVLVRRANQAKAATAPALSGTGRRTAG